MHSHMASAQKVATLRTFAGSSIPDARLRAALIRAGGDLDGAASVLLSDGALGKSDAPIQVAAAASQKVVVEEAQRDTEVVKKKLSSSELRRMAWKQFYLQNYSKAVVAVGMKKEDINAFITDMWKKVGSQKRGEYTRAVRERVESEGNAQPATVKIEPKVNDGAKIETKIEPDAQAKVEIEPEETVKNTPNAQMSSSTNSLLEPINTSVSAPSVPKPTRQCFPSITDQPQPQPNQTAMACHLEEGDSKPEWPKQICSRLCSATMMVSGKKILSAGDLVILEVPQPPRASKGMKGKGKRPGVSGPPRIVRFSKKGREVGRLGPELSHALAPALQSGLVLATCKVVEAPKSSRMFADLFVEVCVYLKKEAFEGQAEQVAAECGVDDKGGENERNDGENGIDARRINVVNMISSLKLCEPPERRDVDFPLPKVEGGEEAGAVSEEGAEVYYRTVGEINRNDVNSFSSPKHLTCTLREYQRAGVGWMVAREKFGSRAVGRDPNNVDFMLNPLWKRKVFPDGRVFFVNPTTGGLSIDAPIDLAGGPYGGILADEMGLGKTVQCIACIVHDIEQQSQGVGATGQSPKNRCEESTTPMMKENNSMQTTEDFVDEIESVPKKVEKVEQDEMIPEHSNTESRKKHETRKRSHGKHTRNLNKGDNRSNKRRRSGRSSARKNVMYKDEVSDDENVNSDSSDGGDDSWCDEPVNGRKEEAAEDSDDDFFESPKEKRKEDVSNHSSTSEDSDDNIFESPPKRRRKSVSNSRSALDELMSTVKSGSPGHGGTLIVCPMSLVTQWMNELELHVAPNFLRTTTHYGTSRRNATSISLHYADVVVTTYGIIASECPEDLRNVSEDGSCAPEGGPLFQISWHRVILDEAHNIKNRTTKWARAAFKLKAEKRWCVTGTVIHNHVNDVFSLLHFLRLKPWSAWAFWNRGIVTNIESKDVSAQKEAMALLRDIISSMTLRRKKNTRDTEGNCIVQLPKKTVEIVRLIPSVQESDFYTALHKRSKVQFDTFVKQGKVMNNFASVLELLLRLRQACDHPYLVFAAPSKDSVVLKDKDKMFKQFLDAGSSSQYVEKVLKEAESGTLQEARECPLCLDVIDDPVAPKECGHPACRACLAECIVRSKKCPVCRTPINGDSIATLPRSTRFAVDLKQKWRPSAKIDALLEDVRVIETNRRKNGGQSVGKTVVFSQFTSMLDLVGMAFEREKIKTLRIDGSIPQAQRAAVLHRFANDDELDHGTANVLLVSLKAGGVGLNLVSAAHAILLDIHWNPQVDAQAQDRVHRHGQTRDVVIKRYIIKGSVEEKLLQVQDRKQDIADGALGVASDEDKKQARMSELKLLFSAQ